MENEHNNHHDMPSPKKEGTLTTPQAIIVAGAMIMGAIFITRPHTTIQTAPTQQGQAGLSQPLSAQVGVSKDALNACIKNTDVDALARSISKSVNSTISEDKRGTPYTIVIGKNGVKAEIQGVVSYAALKKVVDDAAQGIADDPYTGTVNLSEENDHVQGVAGAPITIIEYSDFQCQYCRAFQPNLEQLMKDEAGQVTWIYRHFPIHQHSFEMIVASDCIAKIAGEDAFWKYADLLFNYQDQTFNSADL